MPLTQVQSVPCGLQSIEINYISLPRYLENFLNVVHSVVKSEINNILNSASKWIYIS